MVMESEEFEAPRGAGKDAPFLVLSGEDFVQILYSLLNIIAGSEAYEKREAVRLLQFLLRKKGVLPEKEEF